MPVSPELRQFVLETLETYGRGDLTGFLDAHAPDAVGIGAQTHEWAVGREELDRVFGAEIAAGTTAVRPLALEAFEDGDAGFAVGSVAFELGDSRSLPARLSIVARREDDDWRIVHFHASVGF